MIFPDSRGISSGHPVLDVDVWTMLYLLSCPPPPLHNCQLYMGAGAMEPPLFVLCITPAVGY